MTNGEFYNWRRQLLAPLGPNPGHTALAEMERTLSAHFTLVTQNIDGLRQRAGSTNVIELHGNLWRVRCIRCRKVYEDKTSPLPPLPACNSCGALLRPHVVWFGESLDPQVLNAAYEAIQNCALMMVIGASGTVQPAASMGVEAKRYGATVAKINLEPTPFSDIYTISIMGKSGEILPRLSCRHEVRNVALLRSKQKTVSCKLSS
ncbi:MAG: Sir2 family NAD-dependent protein deacetylase [Syntrophobacteraceae bacterium]|nr:Sir2 family NAD-dependent protein deacetylase [Syntrophobacteraceae bacterium]